MFSAFITVVIKFKKAADRYVLRICNGRCKVQKAANFVFRTTVQKHKRLRFGQFLNFATTVANIQTIPSDLSGRSFRKFWEQTDKNPNYRPRFMAAFPGRSDVYIVFVAVHVTVDTPGGWRIPYFMESRRKSS